MFVSFTLKLSTAKRKYWCGEKDNVTLIILTLKITIYNHNLGY